MGTGFGKEGDGIGWPGCGTVEAVQAAEKPMRKCQLAVFRRIVLGFYGGSLFGKTSNLRRCSVGGCSIIGKRSISRVLSGYFRDPDDHFSTSMVTHAL